MQGPHCWSASKSPVPFRSGTRRNAANADLAEQIEAYERVAHAGQELLGIEGRVSTADDGRDLVTAKSQRRGVLVVLGESRKRQADVTEALAKQVFEAVELLVAGFEAAASRVVGEGRHDWLRAALEAEEDHFYHGVLSVVLRLVFLLYAEDQSLLPVEHPTYEKHLSLTTLYDRLAHDAGAHPESMHHRFGAYGQLLSLFRSVFFGIRHGSLVLP